MLTIRREGRQTDGRLFRDSQLLHLKPARDLAVFWQIANGECENLKFRERVGGGRAMSGQHGGMIKAFRPLFQRIKGRMIQVVPECDEVCEFDCRESECSLVTWGTCERRLEHFIGASAEKGSARYASPRQPGGNVKIKAGWRATDARVYAEDFTAVLWELEWTVETRKVMVFPGGDAPPIRRVEIDIKDPKNVPATADALANALQECGLTLRAAYESGVPVNEIWLTFPQNDDAPAVMSLGGYFKPLHESLRLK